MNIEQKIWTFLYSKIGNSFGTAGVMGNLYAESALNPQNLENAYEKRLGYNDASYTAAVDSGKYGNFTRDSAGYGLAQWTYWSRKAALLAYAKAKGTSIGDLDMQLNFLWKELTEDFPGVVAALKAAKSVREASDVFMCKFENPANQSEAAKANRAKYGQGYFAKYVKVKAEVVPVKWYEKSGEWAEAKRLGITDGTRPDDPATRAEVAAMILRAQKL